MTQRKSALLPAVAAILFAMPAFSQTDFQYSTYATPYNDGVSLAGQNAHAADFNGDGLADVLAGSDYSCSGGTCKVVPTLYLYLNNGGGFNAPVELPVSIPGGSSAAMEHQVAVSDFNGDGKLDIAALNANGQVTMLYGNGDGTFQAPVIVQVTSQVYTSIVAADFDDNNTQDLALLNQNGGLTLLFNDGKGNFTSQTLQIDSPPSAYTTTTLTVGEFNGDGRPDLAWVEQGNAGDQTNNVMTALNTAKGVFSTAKDLGTTPAGVGFLRSADVDLDGKSDLITWSTQMYENCCETLPITIDYSNGDGTFTSSNLGFEITDDVAVTDINGDGVPDVLVSGNAGLTVFIGTSNRSFTNDGTYTSLPGEADLQAIGFFDKTNHITLATTKAVSTGDNEYPMYMLANDNAQDECAYPAGAGVTFCQATQTGGSVRVRGTARAQTQPVRHIELWANSQKLYQVFSDEFDATLSLPPGTTITAVEVEANGATRSATTKTAAVPCAPPTSPGVHVCSPTRGEVTQSPIAVVAAGTGASGSVNHMELWIDGNKVGNYSGATMSASVPLANGSHTVTVVEVDSKGADVKSSPVTFTAGSTGTCSAPSSPGVHVCSPTQGETTSSPVAFVATGKGASGAVNHLELWVDGNKIGNYSGATMNASVAIAAGSHTATVIEVDSKGNYVKSSPVTYTVN
ncbi:MAG: FG-GAP-like repeat-containing protein [Acidobacteriaceae bacterium]